MYLQETDGLMLAEPVLVQCDICKKQWTLLLLCARRSQKKNGGKHVCRSCKAKLVVKPQNLASYWTAEKKASLAESIKGSTKYREAIRKRDTSGPNNGMYGKKASLATRQKMSKSRRGKTGPNATAWKGGKTSVNCRVKGYCHREYNWYQRVYQRDGFKCRQCGSKRGIDAHHIDPISSIIKRLCLDRSFSSNEEKVAWLFLQPEIVDQDLTNGITLCRTCHKQAHGQWGSHNARSDS